MTFARQMRLLSLVIVAGLILATSADAQYKKQRKAKQDRQMSGIVSSVETRDGMMTVRLDNGDVFAAPAERIRIRDTRQNAAAKKSATNDAANPPARRRAVTVSSSESIPVGSRVVVRRKLDKDGNLKRVVVRIVEQQ